MKPLLSFIAASLILITLTGVAVQTISTPKTIPAESPVPDDTDIKLNRAEYTASVWNENNDNENRRNLSPAGHQAASFVNESGEHTCAYKATYYDDETGQRVFVYVD
jgi:hypothetical protein